MKRYLTLLLTVITIVCLVTACNSTKDSDSKQEKEAESIIDTMVIGINKLNGIFNPFFFSSSYDAQINEMVFSTICELDTEGKLVDNAGHIETELVKAEDGHKQVKYTISIKKDMTFSDGEPVTIDDVLFYYYVCSDPTYDGLSTFSNLDIVGLKEYYYDTKNYKKLMEEVENTYSKESISEEDFINYLIETNCGGWFDNKLPGNIGDGTSWAEYLKNEGYDASDIKTQEDMLALLARCEYDNYAEDYDPFSYYKQKIITDNLDKGAKIDTISGIQRVDDYTCTVLMDSLNMKAEKELSMVPIMPEHYYGKGFKKGDISSIKELNGKPLGCGPYIFEGYDNNIVSMKANERYFKGKPKTPYLKFQLLNEEDKLNAILSGEIDITEPNASLELIEEIKENNNIFSSLVDNPGYGYIAINAERVPDKNVRKGLMHLMNRRPAIVSYYGELGEVIERPMTPTLAEYPKNAKEYYGYDKEKAEEFFKAAGYKKKNGKLMKNGEPLKITVGIAEASTHPSTPILTQMANDMEDLGGELIVNNLESNVLTTKVRGGELDMWVQAWGNSLSCDLSQTFGSKGGSNFHRYYDSNLDKIQSEILGTLDFEKRCKLVEEELDMIMEAAIYMPVYQRKNMELFNAQTINIDTLPKETTIYYNYIQEIEKIEMN